ncbi:MAG: YihY/virulence factor BrkB family protein [Flavobacterium sp.]|nr:YihY/virulence factor BrkB family protein [Candidatus Neoflavobacterium equi]
MPNKIEAFLLKIPIVNKIILLAQAIYIPGLEGLSVYEFLEIYIGGIAKGAFSYRAGSIAFSFFMAIFPFALFILNLIPYIPLEGFQTDFLHFVEQSVPPNTFEAIEAIIKDILHNSYKSLLSSGFILSIFLMSNGVNAILGGFQSSYHIGKNSRSFIRQYAISIIISIVISLLLIFIVAAIVVSEVVIQGFSQNLNLDDVLIIQIARYALVIVLIFSITSVLFKFGTRETKNIGFFNAGAIFTTLLMIISSYAFGIYVVKFARYNELYGSIGTILVLMIYIWLNCIILLLGFEINAVINNYRSKNIINKN